MNPADPATPAPLAQRTCTARHGDTARLTEAQADALLVDLPGWARARGEIAKTFAFRDYYETIAFVNATATVSHRQDHHPDLEVGYNRCRVRYTTHSVGGLSENDFICAAKIEAMVGGA